jgi:hypothetical protein
MRLWGKINEVKREQQLLESGIFDKAIKQFSIAILQKKRY